MGFGENTTFGDLIYSKSLDKGAAKFHATDNCVLIDIRDREDFLKGHVPGSVNIPVDDLESDILDAAPDADMTVYIYCYSGNKSIDAAVTLRDMGYDNAYSVGGINSYSGQLET